MHLAPLTFRSSRLFVLNYKCCIELIEGEINTENGWMCVWSASMRVWGQSILLFSQSNRFNVNSHCIDIAANLRAKRMQIRTNEFTLSAQMCQKVCITKPSTCVLVGLQWGAFFDLKIYAVISKPLKLHGCKSALGSESYLDSIVSMLCIFKMFKLTGLIQSATNHIFSDLLHWKQHNAQVLMDYNITHTGNNKAV